MKQKLLEWTLEVIAIGRGRSPEQRVWNQQDISISCEYFISVRVSRVRSFPVRYRGIPELLYVEIHFRCHIMMDTPWQHAKLPDSWCSPVDLWAVNLPGSLPREISTPPVFPEKHEHPWWSHSDHSSFTPVSSIYIEASSGNPPVESETKSLPVKMPVLSFFSGIRFFTSFPRNLWILSGKVVAFLWIYDIICNRHILALKSAISPWGGERYE